MSMSIAALGGRVASGDDAPWCGTVPHPHPHFDLSSLSSALDRVALNPQPLPPKADAVLHAGLGSFAADDEQCGNGIIKFPPGPPPPLGDIAGQIMSMLTGR